MKEKNVKNKNNNRNEINSLLGMFIRYILALIFGLNIWILELIFLPLTFYPVSFILNLFFNVQSSIPYLAVNGSLISLVSACIAPSAYYFLIAMNLITKGIDIKKRIKMILFSFFLFLIINILRIIFLSALFVNSFSFFDLTHKILWYGLSAVFVVLVWLLTVKIFKVNSIPFNSDFLYFKKIRGF